MILFNIATGRTEDFVEIGYHPFRWTHTKDYKHFFISYRKLPGSNMTELIHYDMTAQKAEISEDIPGLLKDLVLGIDETRLYATTATAKDKSQLITLSYGPLKIEHTLPTEKAPGYVYFLSEDIMALVSYAWIDYAFVKGGSVMLLNVKDYKPVQKMEFCKSRTRIYSRWFKKERILIIIDGYKEYRPDVYKVTSAGIIKNTAGAPWGNFLYLPDLDRLYLLGMEDIEEFDYPNQKQLKIETGVNYSIGQNAYFYYNLFQIPDTHILAMYSSVNGKGKFYSMTEHKVIANVTCGRPNKRFKILLGHPSEAELTVNQDKTRFFMVCVASKDITVFDEKYNVLDYIIPEDAPLSIFQVKKPMLRTLVATVKSLSAIGSDSKTLELIAQYERSEWAQFYEDENKILFWTNKEFFILKKDTFEIVARYSFYGDTGDFGDKERLRYRFLYNLE